jgi:xanthine dehydrogenase accessory factor
MDVVVVGAGHVGTALAPLLAGLGFRVTVCDSRETFADPARFGAVPGDLLAVLHGDPDEPPVAERVARPEGAAFLVMTHDHGLDQVAIEHGLTKKFAFVGGVGSRAKAVRTRARLSAKGFSAADIARFRMPLGVGIGARSPAEIAVAVAAELIAFRAGVQASPKSGASESAGESGAEASGADESAGESGASESGAGEAENA